MPNALTVAQLQNAQKMITAGNLAGFYQYMAGQGYKYATLAEGVVTGAAPSGIVALGFMQASAAAQGKSLTAAQITKIETDMANGYANALIASANSNGVISADINGQQALAIHNSVFPANNLDPSTWTLYTPAQILGPTQFNTLFQQILNAQGNMTAEIAADANLTAEMDACMKYCPDPAQAAAATKWMGTAGSSLPYDINLFLQQKQGATVPTGSNWNTPLSNSMAIGQDVNISSLADQLAEIYIPRASTITASVGEIDIGTSASADAAANAAARQQLVQTFTNQLQSIQGKTSGIQSDYGQQTASGDKLDNLKGYTASGAQQYQQLTDTASSGAISATISGTGDVANLTKATISLANGTSDTINGSNDTINAGTNTITALYGTGGIVNFVPNSGSILKVYNANSSASVNGTGNTVGIFASGDNVSASGDTFNFSTGGLSSTITGNNDTINAGSNSLTALYGVGNIVNFVANSTSQLNLYTANAATTFNGSGNTIGVFGANDSISAAGDTISLNSGLCATVTGGNDALQLLGNGDSLVLSSGTGYTVHGGLNDTVSIYGSQTDNVSMTSGSEIFYTQAGLKTADELFNAGSETDYLGFSSTGTETYDEKFNTAGQETDYDLLAPSGQITQDEQFNVSTGKEVDALNYTNGVKTDEAFYSTAGTETADEKFSTSGQETDYDLLASNGQITQDEQFNVSTGKEVDALNYTNGVKTDEAFYNTGGSETNDEFFNSAGAETSNTQFDATGHKADVQCFAGTATNDYETNQINYNVSTGGEASELDYNSAGKETDVLDYAGTATNDYETNRINFNVSTGGETSELDYNSAGKQTDVIDYAGTATNNYETNQINYNVTTGGETSELDYNSAGKETDVLDYAGTATNDYETNRINFNVSTGGETSELDYNSAGKQTDVIDYVGTATNDYETNQINYNVSTGGETSELDYNSAGKETDVLDYAGTATNDYETNRINFNVSTGGETSELDYNSAGKETDVLDYAGTATNDYETNRINFNVSTGGETSELDYNSAGKETDVLDYAGTATNDYETNRINFNVSTGGETSELDYNSAGKETDIMNYVGTATNDYETNQINFSTTTGGETAELDYNTAGKETDALNFIGSATNDYETNRINFNTATGWESSELDYSSAGKETDVINFAGVANNDYETNEVTFSTTTGTETSNTMFNSTGHETEYQQFQGAAGNDYETLDEKFNPSSGNYATDIIGFNGSGVETQDENFNASTGSLNSVMLWNGTNPYAYEEEFSNGGKYFSEIETFNASTGALTGGGIFNSTTGAEMDYYNNGYWYAGSAGAGDYGDSGYSDGYDESSDDWGGDCYDDDPVILNLNGGKVQTTALANSPSTFDMRNDGQKIRTGWGTAGEGYLVFDPNDASNTTQVTQDSQLVGGMSALQSLAQTFDGNGSGTLTAGDALWSDLKVWVDTTGTGQFQGGQLYSLDQLGVASINLDGTQVNQNSNGNEIMVDSSFTWANGATGDMAGVNLNYTGGATVGGTSASAGQIRVDNLVTAMASFGAVASASSVLAASAQNDPHALLAASAH